MKTCHVIRVQLVFLLSVYATCALGARQSAPHETVVEGKVCDKAGAPVVGASVQLETDSGQAIATGLTNSSGDFRLKVTTEVTLSVRARQEGFRDTVVSVGKKKMQIVLEKSAPGPAMDFSDSPNFTVAGVTDWSNVGLHGSDVNVKTSEALTKEAAALKAVESNSGHPKNEAETHRLLGDTKERNGDPVAAEREYEIAVKLDPSEENYFALGAELLLHRAGVAAVEVLGKGAAAHPTSQRMLEALGAAYYADDQYAEATRQMCRAADLFPSHVEPYLFLGRIEQAASESFPCSEEKLRAFAIGQKGDAKANFYYALLLFKKARHSQRDADFQQAEEFFQKALSIDPAFGEVYLQLGVMHNALGKKEAALREFEKAVQSSPALSAARYQLSLAYRRAGDTAKADAAMKAYEDLKKSEEEALEQERKAMRQFVTVLKQASPN